MVTRGGLLPSRQLVAQGDGIVVAAENHIHPVMLSRFQGVADFMEAIVRMVCLPEQNRDALVHGPPALVQHPRANHQIARIGGCQSQTAPRQKRLAMKAGRPARPLHGARRRHLKQDLDRAVG